MVDICDPHGNYPLLRPNHVSGPTANVGVRRAIMAALDPVEIMQAATSGEPGTSRHRSAAISQVQRLIAEPEWNASARRALLRSRRCCAMPAMPTNGWCYCTQAISQPVDAMWQVIAGAVAGSWVQYR